jgi:hypothetical protein
MAAAGDLVRGRFDAQRLIAPARSAPAAIDRITAVQAQDLGAARLAVRARTTGRTAADVDALLNDGSATVTWLNRGTLHLVLREDYPWLHALTAPTARTSNQTRLVQEGVSVADADRAAEAIAAWVRDEGPMTRHELRPRVDALGIATAGQAMVHILMRASLFGLITRGPVVGREQGYVAVDQWWPRLPTVDRDEALRELTVRYLRGHAPADEHDLMKWSGLPLRDVRRGFALVADRLVVDGTTGAARLKRQRLLDDVPPPLLLGGYDPILMGWADRDWVLHGAQGVVTRNGLFLPILLVDGRAAGTWRRPSGVIDRAPFAPLTAEQTLALDADAADVERFLAE